MPKTLVYISVVTAIAIPVDAGAQDLRINEILANNQMCCPDDEGDFSDWIEIYNAGNRRVDLTGMYITDDLGNPTDFQIAADSLTTVTVEPGEFLVLWADGDIEDGLTHLGFGLRGAGEQVGLFAADGITLIDSLSFGPQQPDVSFGRKPDGGDSWFFLEEPSPGQSNRSTGKLAFSEPPLFSRFRGVYDGNVSLQLFHPVAEALITYTTDGAVPTRASSSYWGSPILLTATTVVRARAFTAGNVGSDVVTHTFLIDEQFTLPVVSIATDPPNLWDDEIGIYVEGNDRNYLKDWERPASIEFFETDGELGFASDVGLEIHGGWSRRLPQKSVAINFRSKYGTGVLEYRLFAGKEIDEFTEFILRNSGNDWANTLMRDAILQSLIEDRVDLDYQAYQPAILFLNGQYWGIHNLRERINASYISSNYGIPEPGIELLEERAQVRIGDANHYDDLLAFLAESDMSAPETLQQVDAKMETDQFINYQLSEIYFANTDWPSNNIEFWRPRTAEGRWRWILFDTDFGFNLKLALTPSTPDHNTLEFASASDGAPYPNPPWATFLLRTLLEAPDFRDRFVQRFTGHLNTTFQPEHVIALIDSLRDNVVAEIPRHAARWSSFPAPFYGDPFSSVESWEANLEVMREFARQRVDIVRQHLAAKFGLDSQSQLSLTVEPEGAGVIDVNAAAVGQLPWTGPFFSGVPLEVTAVPSFGYEFAAWSDPVDEEQSFSLSLSDDLELTARFAPIEMPPVLINEINYNSSSAFDPGDWVELYNPGNTSVDLSGWIFRDEQESHRFQLPEQTILPAGGYVVICQNGAAMSASFADLGECLGDFSFGLSGEGDRVDLLDSFGRIVDTVLYDDAPPWPQGPDGTGSTLSLRDAGLDNTRAENWAESVARGTPGTANRFGERESGVEIGDFTAAGVGDAVLVTWTTIFEIDNQGFNVYRTAEDEQTATLAGSFRQEKSGLKGRARSTRSRSYVWADDGVEAGVEYSYFLAHVTAAGEEVKHVDSVASARAAVGLQADQSLTLFTYPNPFNDVTTIVFQAADEAKVSVVIYNSLGETVRTLIDGDLLSGSPHVLTWNGTDRAGRSVASGIYLCRIRAGSSTRTAKVLLLR